MGWAEAKGTGFNTSILSLPANDYPSASWNNNERNDTFTIVFPNPKDEVDTTQVTTEVTGEVTTEVAMEVVRMLLVLKGEMKRAEIQEKLKLKNAEHFRIAYIIPALNAEVVEMTVPDKPNSRLQKYRLTAKGRRWLGKTVQN
jgi:ATP-dependent DNA helicase RecG